MQKSFKEWLLREMAHISLEDAADVGGLHIDSIDFRFEDYPKNTQHEMNLIRRLLHPSRMPFYGKLPNSSRYVVFDGEALNIVLKIPIIDVWYAELPENWWKYAAFYDGDELVRPFGRSYPLRARVYDRS